MSKPTQIWYEGKLEGLANIIDYQYVLQIQPFEISDQISFANTIPIVNAMKTTLELWHQKISYLSYRNIFRLPQFANEIDVKESAPESVYGPCM